jgi:hypothetical protein
MVPGSGLSCTSYALARNLETVAWCMRTFSLRCTHGLFNGGVIEKFCSAGLRVVMLETVSRPQSFYESERSWLTILPIDEMLSNAMHQTMQVGGYVSQLVR